MSVKQNLFRFSDTGVLNGGHVMGKVQFMAWRPTVVDTGATITVIAHPSRDDTGAKFQIYSKAAGNAAGWETDTGFQPFHGHGGFLEVSLVSGSDTGSNTLTLSGDLRVVTGDY